MADPSSVSRSLSRICDHCQTLLQKVMDPRQYIGTQSFWEGLTLEPKQCRICLLISSFYNDYWSSDRPSDQIDLGLYCKRESGTGHQNGIRLISFNNVPRPGPMRYQPITIALADRLDGFMWNRNVPKHTGSVSSMQFLRNKLAECLKDHSLCAQKEAFQTKHRPTRLIEVKDKTICLRDTRHSIGGRYLTLSHCWGHIQLLSLTSQTEPSLRAGFSILDLPRTFREALYVCQELGVRYIWIDSLCIFQDDREDWAREAAVMNDVYSNALCNIAATSSSDSNGGLFYERDIESIQPFWIQVGERPDWGSPQEQLLVISHDGFQKYVGKAPLNKRAWVLQERFLSTRIAHFSEKMVYWECCEHISSELYPESSPNWVTDDLEPVSRLKKLLLRMKTNEKRTGWESWEKAVHRAWPSVVQIYSECGLTKDEDKLVAIIGISRQIKETMGSGLTWGLLEKNMLEELLWFRDISKAAPERPRNWRAPSWSWASWNAPIVDVSLGNSRAESNPVRTARVESIEEIRGESGHTQQVRLMLRGKIFWGHIVRDEKREAQFLWRTQSSNLYPTIRIVMDDLDTLDLVGSPAAIVLLSWAVVPDHVIFIKGLVLREHQGEKTEAGFERIGGFSDTVFLHYGEHWLTRSWPEENIAIY